MAELVRRLGLVVVAAEPIPPVRDQLGMILQESPSTVHFELWLLTSSIAVLSWFAASPLHVISPQVLTSVG